MDMTTSLVFQLNDDLTYKSGFEMAIFFDTVKEDLASCHDDGLGTRTMRTADVRWLRFPSFYSNMGE